MIRTGSDKNTLDTKNCLFWDSEFITLSCHAASSPLCQLNFVLSANALLSHFEIQSLSSYKGEAWHNGGLDFDLETNSQIILSGLLKNVFYIFNILSLSHN